MRRLVVLALTLTACHGGNAATGNPPPGPPVMLAPAWPALQFDQPVHAVAMPDQSGRMCVVEQTGRVRVFDDRIDVAATAVFLDLSATVVYGGEMGLLGLAFAPDFASSGALYVSYTGDPPRRSVLARYRVFSGDSGHADPATAEILLEVSQPFTNHNGGTIAFGADGMLYMGFGDGGSADDPLQQAQAHDSLLGKLLRLDVAANGHSGAYQVPADNPFVGVVGYRPEIWALGLRNPWRWAFDRVTGELWIGDVGQGQREEITVAAAGDNCGWPVYEGDLLRQPALAASATFKAPRHSYDHSRGNCVIGGVVYRGRDVPALAGAYLFTDFGAGTVQALLPQASGGQLVALGLAAGVSAFAEDTRGEVLLLQLGGQVLRMTAGAMTVR